MRKNRIGTCLNLVAAGLVAAGAVGCSTKPTANGWSPPSPELATLGESSKEVENILKRSDDLSRRMITEDLARIMFVDRASRLNNKPTPW